MFLFLTKDEVSLREAGTFRDGLRFFSRNDGNGLSKAESRERRGQIHYPLSIIHYVPARGVEKKFGFAEKKRLASRFFFAKSNLRKETGTPSPLVFHAISKQPFKNHTQ